eukprot:7391743-Pyramimonas_sp.AAC.1
MRANSSFRRSFLLVFCALYCVATRELPPQRNVKSAALLSPTPRQTPTSLCADGAPVSRRVSERTGCWWDALEGEHF